MYSSPLRITVWKAVDAYWHPLTPEHGFPSLISYMAQGAPPRPAACWRIPFPPFPKYGFCYFFFCHLFRKHNNPELFKSDDIKTGDTHRGMSPVKIHIMTSYGGIIRIRLKGRSSITSSQPANELPCFYQICNVSMLNHRQTYYSASGEIFKCDFLVHFYPLSFHDQGQRKRPPDSGESHNATQKNR